MTPSPEPYKYGCAFCNKWYFLVHNLILHEDIDHAEYLKQLKENIQKTLDKDQVLQYNAKE